MWLPKFGNGGNCPAPGVKEGKPAIMGMLERLKPRGVPAVSVWLFMGKWPLELASEREGAMWEGSRT